MHKNNVKEFMKSVSRRKLNPSNWFAVSGCEHCDSKKDLFFLMLKNDGPLFLCEACLNELLDRK